MKEITNGIYTVKEIEAKQVNSLVKEFHYSAKVVANSKLHLGIFDADSNLIGCLQFGPPMNGNKTAIKLSEQLPMFELNRMVMHDNQPRNSESMAIGLCIKYLKKFTDCKWLLSFSDGKEGNVGYIYQATNWLYLGYMLSDSFYKLDGKYMHNVSVWHKYKEKHPDRDVKTTDQILFDNYENVSKVSCKQHIYVMPLHKTTKFKFEKQKYPKLETEVPIVKQVTLKQDGLVLIPKKVELFTDEVIKGIF